MFGWAGKILRVDLTSRKISKEPYPREFRRNFIGGRGVNDKILYDEVPPLIHPLSSENKLIIGTGPFTGTVFGGNGRWNATSKSPQTGIFGDGNGGGHWGADLKFAGYDHIIIEGISERPIYLWVDDDHVELRDASHLWGMDVWETTNLIKKELGDPSIKVMGIGPAGENLVRFAVLVCDHARTAGRPGMGCVMGSKRLKAIAVRGTKGLKVAHPDRIENLFKQWYREVTDKENPVRASYLTMGTTYLPKMTANLGFLRGGYFETAVYSPEELQALAGETLMQRWKTKSKGCFACPLHCSRSYKVTTGPFVGVAGEGPEYECMSDFGAGIHNTYVPSILKANDLCNKLGMDVNSAANVISMAYYFYNNGYIREKDTDGLKLEWGDYRPMLQLLEKIVYREGFGDILAEGEYLAAKRIRLGLEDLVYHSKGLGASAYEGRALKGSALTFATSSRGYDHLKGMFFWDFKKKLGGTARELFGDEADVPISYDQAKALGAIWVQNACALRDAYQICSMVSPAHWFNEPSLHLCADIFRAITGFDMSDDEIWKCGERIWTIERCFNVREGCMRKDDSFGPRAYDEPLPEGLYEGERIDREKFDQLLSTYYNCRSWDVKTSAPTPLKLEELGLEYMISDMEEATQREFQKGDFSHQIPKTREGSIQRDPIIDEYLAINLKIRKMEKKRKEENEFRALIDKNAEWRKAYGKAWDETARAQGDFAGFFKPYMYQTMRNSLTGFANQIVKYVAEVKKPDGERLPGYHDSELDELKFYLFSPAPIYPELEEAELGDGLQASLEELGANDPFIKTALNGKSPADAAKELVTKTKLSDPAVRKSLLEGGETAVAASQDPMIVLARALDPMSRAMRKRYENAVESVESAAGEKIGKARFSAYGKEASPDATFTLRLSFGAVKGYPMNGTKAPYKTLLYGLYERFFAFDKKPPFDLPLLYVERKAKLDLATPVNFVCACDIIGGNSGSPVIDKNGEIVGLIFDGNIESLVGRYVYNEEANRAVAVHTAIMIETLRKLYDAAPLADELEGKTPRAIR